MKLSSAFSLKAGDALLFRGVAPYSKAIEARTDSVYSHAALVVSANHAFGHRAQPVLVEALEGKGVRMYPLNRYLRECRDQGCEVDWYRVNPHVRRMGAAVAWAIDQTGSDYAMGQVIWSFGFISQAIRRLFGSAVTLDHQRWFCSEIVAAAYAKANLVIPKVPALMSPQDVSELPYLCLQGSLEPDEDDPS